MRNLEVFDNELLADQLPSVTIGFERGGLHRYHWDDVRLTFQQTTDAVAGLSLEEEIRLQVYGMPVPAVHYIYEIEQDRSAGTKTVKLAPYSKKMAEFRCGILDFQQYGDTDYHLTRGHVTDLVLHLLYYSMFRSETPGGIDLRDIIGLYDLYGVHYSTEIREFLETAALTAPVEFTEVAFGLPGTVDDLMPPGNSYRFFTLEGDRTAADANGINQVLPAGLYVYIGALVTNYIRYPNLFHLDRHGHYHSKGIWEAYPALSGAEEIPWKNLSEISWSNDPEFQADIGALFGDQDQPATASLGARYFDRTWRKLAGWNYDDGLGPFWGFLKYDAIPYTYERVSYSGGASQTGWFRGQSQTVTRVFYSKNFLNHFVRADYTNPTTVDIWNDVAKLAGGFWYLEGKIVHMRSRARPAVSEMVYIPGDDMLAWHTTIRPRQKTDDFPSDNLQINTTLREQITATMDAIYGEQEREHRIQLYQHPRDPLRPGDWIRSGNTILGMVRRVTYHRDRRVSLETVGGDV